MNEFLVVWPIEAFEVGNVQSADGLDRHGQRCIRLTVLSQGLSCRPQNPEDPRSIEPLTFTMLAEAHGVPCLV
jgi:hypothetical protein